jgi:intracellular sulfur oxidation DsrE/DsrF family protein
MIKAKRSIAVIALLLCLFGSWSNVLGQAKTHHVVFAVTSGEDEDWKLVMGNMRNLLKSFGDTSYEVELVAFGPGLMIVTNKSTVAAEIKAFQAQHVHFMACENSMRSRNVAVADLLPDVQPVPSGIVEVVTKQEQGWVYIKGGR